MVEWRTYSILLPGIHDIAEPVVYSERGLLDVEVVSAEETLRGLLIDVRFRAISMHYGAFEDRVSIHCGPAVGVLVVSGNVPPPQAFH